MDRKTLIALIVGVVLLIGVGIGCYILGRNSNKPLPPSPPVLVSDTVWRTLPGKQRLVERVVSSDSATISARREALEHWASELRRVADSLGQYGALYVEADTTISREISVVGYDEKGEHVIANTILSDRLQLRYGVPPIDYLALVAGKLLVRLPMESFDSQLILESPSTWDRWWDTYRNYSALTVTLAIIGGILYLVL